MIEEVVKMRLIDTAHSELLVGFFSAFREKVPFLRTDPYGMLYMFSDQNFMGNSMKLFSIQKNTLKKLSIETLAHFIYFRFPFFGPQ